MMATTVVNITLSPGLAANTFSKTGAVIFIGSIYGALFLGTILFVWVLLSGMDNVLSCCSCCGERDDDFFFSGDDEGGRCAKCGDSIKSSCCALMWRFACLKLYMLCCGCSPRFRRYAEMKIWEMELDIEKAESRESNKDSADSIDPTVFVVTDEASDDGLDIFGDVCEPMIDTDTKGKRD